MKDADKIPIANMPSYGRTVVVMYGSLVKKFNKSKAPNCQVVLRSIDNNGNVVGNDFIVYIPISDLDAVRIGTILENKKKLNIKANQLFQPYETSYEIFNFYFNNTQAEMVSCNQYLKELGTSLSNIYNVNLKLSYNNLKKILDKSTFTKLVDTNGKIVLTPSLEFFTGTYAPDHKNIRERLLSYDIDTAISKFVRFDKCEIHDDKYILGVYEKMVTNNLKFLGFAKFHEFSRQSFKKLWMSLEYETNDFDSGSIVRYPVVLPWQPNYLQLQCEGIWLNQNVYLVHKIVDRSSPESPVVEAVKYRTKYTTNEIEKPPKETEYEGSEESSSDPVSINPSPDDLDSNEPPSPRNGKQQTKTTVGIIGDNYDVKFTVVDEIKEVNTLSENDELPENKSTQKPSKNKDEEEEEGVLSSSESDSSKDSKNNVELEIGNEKYNEASHNLFQAVITALDENIKDEECDLKSFYYLHKDFKESQVLKETYFYHFMKQNVDTYPLIKKYGWHRLRRRDEEHHVLDYLGYRGYLLVHLVLENDKHCYLFEIGKKDTERFSGLIFYLNDLQEFQEKNFHDILKSIINKEGVKGLVLDDNMKTTTYKHKFDEANNKYIGLDKTIKKKLKDLLK